MYSSPIVVLAGSSVLRVVPTATRMVPCAKAGAASPAAKASATMKRRMVSPKPFENSRVLERLRSVRIDRARNVSLRHRRVVPPESCQGRDWRPIPVDAQVHVREGVAIDNEERRGDERLE